MTALGFKASTSPEELEGETARLLPTMMVLATLAALLATAAEVSASSTPPLGCCWEPAAPKLDLTLPVAGLPPHPRLRLNDSALLRLNATIQSDPVAQAYYKSMYDRGVAMLSDPPVACAEGGQMLEASRAVLVMQYTLGMLHRLTDEERFAKRATAELLHVTTNCSTWDPFG